MGGAAGVDVSNWSKVDPRLIKENARQYFGDKITMGTVLQTFHDRKRFLIQYLSTPLLSLILIVCCVYSHVV